MLMIGATEDAIVDSVPNAKRNRVGLVFGTSPWVANGNKNLYFKYRMQAAAQAYKSGQIRHILVSGDNRKKNYNEPVAMQKALLELGVKENDITLDYAGRRTLDAVVRAKKIFLQDELVLISQRFHLYRGLYLCQSHGVDAIGLEAKSPSTALNVPFRESFARVLALIDAHIAPTDNIILGKEEPIQ